VPPPIEALKDEDEGVRLAAAEALGEIKSPEAVPHLIEALKDEDEDVRWAAALALGEIKSPEAVPHLIEALKDEDEGVRSAAAWALGEFKSPEAVPHLIEALKDEDASVRAAAAVALGMWADDLDIPQEQRKREELATLLREVERALWDARRRGADVHWPLTAVMNGLSVLKPPRYFDPLSPEALAGWRGKWEKIKPFGELIGILAAGATLLSYILGGPRWLILALFGVAGLALVLALWSLYRWRHRPRRE